MKQCKDNCLCWQLANRLALCYCQAYLSCPPSNARLHSSVHLCVFVCFFGLQRKGGRSGGRSNCKINRLLYKGHYPQLCEWLAFASTIVFLFPFSFPLHLRDTGMGPVGLWNICTITSAGSIQSFKLFSVPSLFCFAQLLLHPPPSPPTTNTPHPLPFLPTSYTNHHHAST